MHIDNGLLFTDFILPSQQVLCVYWPYFAIILEYFEWLFPTLLIVLVQRQKDGVLDDLTQWIIEVLQVY